MSPFVTEVALYRLLIRPHRFFAAYTWMFYWSRVVVIRLRPEYTQENLNIVRPDDLGFYSCREIYDKNNYDFERFSQYQLEVRHITTCMHFVERVYLYHGEDTMSSCLESVTFILNYS
jgi:hypothetical protein